MNKKYIIGIIVIIIIIILGAFILTNSNISSDSIHVDVNALEDKGNLVVDNEKLDENNGLYHAESSDLNTIIVKNNGILKLSNSFVNKTGDTQTSGDDADFYGVNSAVLVNTNGTAEIHNVEISVHHIYHI